jgi:hypothetical protein
MARYPLRERARFHRTPFQTVRAVFPHTAYRCSWWRGLRRVAHGSSQPIQTHLTVPPVGDLPHAIPEPLPRLGRRPPMHVVPPWRPQDTSLLADRASQEHKASLPAPQVHHPRLFRVQRQTQLGSLSLRPASLLPSLSRAFDTPLGSVGSLLPAGVCYRTD